MSEVNPARSVIPPGEQATKWFGLFSDAEGTDLVNRTYVDQIKEIAAQTAKTSRNLVIRDWVGINYLQGISDWVPLPSNVLEQRIYLSHAGFKLREVRMLRRSAAVYQSLVQNIEGCARLSVDEFAKIYTQFLQHTAHAQTLHFEAFTRSPKQQLAHLCKLLDVDEPERFEDRFYLETRVTGNTTIGTNPKSAKWKSIHTERQLPEQANAHPDASSQSMAFRELDRIAGYPEGSAHA